MRAVNIGVSEQSPLRDGGRRRRNRAQFEEALVDSPASRLRTPSLPDPCRTRQEVLPPSSAHMERSTRHSEITPSRTLAELKVSVPRVLEATLWTDSKGRRGVSILTQPSALASGALVSELRGRGWTVRLEGPRSMTCNDCNERTQSGGLESYGRGRGLDRGPL